MLGPATCLVSELVLCRFHGAPFEYSARGGWRFCALYGKHAYTIRGAFYTNAFGYGCFLPGFCLFFVFETTKKNFLGIRAKKNNNDFLQSPLDSLRKCKTKEFHGVISRGQAARAPQEQPLGSRGGRPNPRGRHAARVRQGA